MVAWAASRFSSPWVSSTRHSSSFRPFEVGHAFLYKMQLVTAVREGQYHNLTEQMQAEQQQHFSHFLPAQPNKAVSNTINCSGEKPLVIASGLKNYWQAKVLAVTTLTWGRQGGIADWSLDNKGKEAIPMRNEVSVGASKPLGNI